MLFSYKEYESTFYWCFYLCYIIFSYFYCLSTHYIYLVHFRYFVYQNLEFFFFLSSTDNNQRVRGRSKVEQVSICQIFYLVNNWTILIWIYRNFFLQIRQYSKIFSITWWNNILHIPFHYIPMRLLFFTSPLVFSQNPIAS